MPESERLVLSSFVNQELERSFTESLQRARQVSGFPIANQSIFACPSISVEADADVVFAPIVLQAAP